MDDSSRQQIRLVIIGSCASGKSSYITSLWSSKSDDQIAPFYFGGHQSKQALSILNFPGQSIATNTDFLRQSPLSDELNRSDQDESFSVLVNRLRQKVLRGFQSVRQLEEELVEDCSKIIRSLLRQFCPEAEKHYISPRKDYHLVRDLSDYNNYNRTFLEWWQHRQEVTSILLCLQLISEEQPEKNIELVVLNLPFSNLKQLLLLEQLEESSAKDKTPAKARELNKTSNKVELISSRTIPLGRGNFFLRI